MPSERSASSQYHTNTTTPLTYPTWSISSTLYNFILPNPTLHPTNFTSLVSISTPIYLHCPPGTIVEAFSQPADIWHGAVLPCAFHFQEQTRKHVKNTYNHDKQKPPENSNRSSQRGANRVLCPPHHQYFLLNHSTNHSRLLPLPAPCSCFLPQCHLTPNSVHGSLLVGCPGQHSSSFDKPHRIQEPRRSQRLSEA